MKFWEIYRFELFYQLRRPTVWIYILAVFGLIYLVIDEIVDYARTVETVLLNSPITVAEITGFANKFGLLLMAALVGDGAMRDIQARMDPLIYTSSITKKMYLGARFLGILLLASVLMLLLVPLGLLTAQYAMGLESTLLGSFRPLAYLHAGLFLTLPNVFFATALMWALVLFSRQAMSAYLGALLFFVISTFNMEVLGQNWQLGKLVDPSGITVVEEFRRSLPPLQASTALLPLKGYLLANRLLWLGISIVIGAVAYGRFKLSYPVAGLRWKWKASRKAAVPVKNGAVPAKTLAATGLFDSKARIYQTYALATNFYQEIMNSPMGLTIPAIALYTFILIPNLSEGPVGVPLLPTTERVLLYMNSSALQIFVMLLITLLAGQMVWRERDSRIHEISDATPVPDLVLLLSKYFGLTLVLLTLQAALVIAGIGVQLRGNYHQPDIGLLLQELFGVQLLDLLLLAAMAMAIHILVNQKYVGHLLVLLFYFYTLKPSLFGIEHRLLQFGSDTGLSTSIFWSQGTFLLPWMLYKTYWTGWTLLWMLVAKHLWVRGRETGIKRRLLQGYKGLNNSPLLLGLAALVVSTGALIFYNTNILNEYVTKAESIKQQVEYEKRYGQYKENPQPYLTGTTLYIEFYPEKRSALVQGIYQLKNGSNKPIDTLHLSPASEVATNSIRFNRKTITVLTDNKLGHLIYKLEQPLQPGDSLQMHFQLSFNPQGFSNRGINTAVMENGTYFSNWSWLPAIGYQSGRELNNNSMRKELGLSERMGHRTLQDEKALQDRSEQERIRFEATIGTLAGQTAVAPGTLKKSWREGERQYFYYVADKPIQNMYHIYSARYELRESRWKGINLQIYYHPRNQLNLDRFEQAIKASVNYYEEHFSPYPFHQLRFVEYADPGTGGISLPGTVGYSSNFALLNPAQDSRGFDLPFAVVAHEVAHQWWGHQLTPADVEGAPFLTESLAWYSALGVVEQAHGMQHLQNLLDAMRQEYLAPRSRAAVPLLYATDGFQAYRKGPLAMYALREYVGEETINLALQNLLKKFNSGEPPFATSLNFYEEMQAVTPDSVQYLLKDLFATNTFWELQTKAATVKQDANGGWIVIMDVEAQKVQVDEDGLETKATIDEYIEIVVFGKSEEGAQNTLYSKKHRIQSGSNRIRIIVNQKPEKAGIDPRHLLIDTEMYDNVRPVMFLTEYQ